MNSSKLLVSDSNSYSTNQESDEQESDEQESDEQESDDQESNDQESDEQESDNQESDEQESDDQESDNQESDNQESDQESNNHETDNYESNDQESDNQGEDVNDVFNSEESNNKGTGKDESKQNILFSTDEEQDEFDKLIDCLIDKYPDKSFCEKSDSLPFEEPNEFDKLIGYLIDKDPNKSLCENLDSVLPSAFARSPGGRDDNFPKKECRDLPPGKNRGKADIFSSESIFFNPCTYGTIGQPNSDFFDVIQTKTLSSKGSKKSVIEKDTIERCIKNTVGNLLKDSKKNI